MEGENDIRLGVYMDTTMASSDLNFRGALSPGVRVERIVDVGQPGFFATGFSGEFGLFMVDGTAFDFAGNISGKVSYNWWSSVWRDPSLQDNAWLVPFAEVGYYVRPFSTEYRSSAGKIGLGFDWIRFKQWTLGAGVFARLPLDESHALENSMEFLLTYSPERK